MQKLVVVVALLAVVALAGAADPLKLNRRRDGKKGAAVVSSGNALLAQAKTAKFDVSKFNAKMATQKEELADDKGLTEKIEKHATGAKLALCFKKTDNAIKAFEEYAKSHPDFKLAKHEDAKHSASSESSHGKKHSESSESSESSKGKKHSESSESSESSKGKKKASKLFMLLEEDAAAAGSEEDGDVVLMELLSMEDTEAASEGSDEAFAMEAAAEEAAFQEDAESARFPSIKKKIVEGVKKLANALTGKSDVVKVVVVLAAEGKCNEPDAVLFGDFKKAAPEAAAPADKKEEKPVAKKEEKPAAKAEEKKPAAKKDEKPAAKKDEKPAANKDKPVAK